MPENEIIDADFVNANISKDTQDLEEVFAYKFVSIGSIRFQSKHSVPLSIEHARYGDTDRQWESSLDVDIEETREWTKAKHLEKLKTLLIEANLATAEDVCIHHKRGLVLIDKARNGRSSVVEASLPSMRPT